MGVHSTAIVDPNAKIGDDVSIGPFSVIEAGVSIGDRTSVGNNVIISSGTYIGKDCKIFHSASIGAIPQDLKFNNEETFLSVSYTHLRAHETKANLVCRLLLEKKYVYFWC